MRAHTIERIGFIGIGDIGFPMATRLLNAGYEIIAYDLDQSTMERFTEIGGQVASSPGAVSEASDSVHIAVVNDEQLTTVLLGDDGIFTTLPDDRQCLIVVHSTVQPQTLSELADHAPPNIKIIDGAVSGTRQRAERGELSMMVGGPSDVIESYLPILNVIASDVFQMGPVGSGLIVKLANNSILYAAAAATLEALDIGRKAGLTEEEMIEVFCQSSGLTFFGQHYEFFMNERANTPAGPTAPIRNSQKTFIQYLTLAQSLNVSVPMGAIASQQYPSLLRESYIRNGILEE